MNEIFKNTRSIAVIGLSPDPLKASFSVGKFLQENDFKIIPMYPREDLILGEKVYRSLDEINENVDLVLMFRKGEAANELLPIIIKKGIKNFWLQLGITNEKVKEECEKLKINFIQDKCIMKEFPLWKNKEKKQ